jgi:hypothetical protein
MFDFDRQEVHTVKKLAWGCRESRVGGKSLLWVSGDIFLKSGFSGDKDFFKIRFPNSQEIKNRKKHAAVQREANELRYRQKEETLKRAKGNQTKNMAAWHFWSWNIS